ncbi:hypothetical protein DFJ74DRAFT_137639 [Hyaloraphidium curvatum]|nr:hypothetical protein DFJ74DRAFT_137639 [Hyaloraphidium curvatum]
MRQILSKPEHQRLISDSFSGAIEIKRFDENATVWFYKYRFGKTPAADRLIRVFEMKRKRVDLSGDPEAGAVSGTAKSWAWLVVFRSIAAITSDEAPQGYADALDTMIQTSIPEELEPPSSSSSGTETYADGAADTGAVLQDRVVLADEPEDWAEQSPEDSELAETLRRLAQQREPTNTGGDDPAPPPLPPRNKAGSASSRPASISSSSVVSTASAASPAPAPTLFISDTTAPARPQNLNSSSSSTSIKSTGAPPAAPNAPASSRLPALMGRTSSPAGGEKEKAAVKGDAGHPLEDTLRVHLYGYLVESIPDDLQACVVTMLTQYSSKSIQRLESSWDVCRQLKISIEELASLSSLPAEETGEDGSPTPSNRRLSRLRQSHVGEDEGKLSAPEKGQRIEKLKSLASGAGKKAYAWWAGKSSAQSSTIGNAVAAGAVIPSSFGVDAKAPRQTDSSSAHAVMFDDADSDDDGSGEVDYEEEEGGHGLPKEALRRSRVTRLLRRAAEKVRPPDEVETVSIYIPCSR